MRLPEKLFGNTKQQLTLDEIKDSTYKFYLRSSRGSDMSYVCELSRGGSVLINNETKELLGTDLDLLTGGYTRIGETNRGFGIGIGLFREN